MENFNQLLHLSNVYNSTSSSHHVKLYNQRMDHFSIPEEEFKKRYRFEKKTALYIVRLIRRNIQPLTTRNHALSARDMVLLTLRFYASGSFLIAVADYSGVSIPTASRVIKKVTMAIGRLSNNFISMPRTEQEIKKTAAGFFKIAKFPKVIGSIDCTHIRIQSPGGVDAELYRNRKGYFSFNVQVVCNANLQINDIVARWPGSSHDSNIFNNSRIKARLDGREFGEYFMLGDSGYAAKSYMMTPLQNPITEAERLYNESQIRTRNTVERCFGVWKRRFPVLSLGLRLSKETALYVIIACAVLHNIARALNDNDPEEEFDINPEVEIDNSEPGPIPSNSLTRNNLIRNYFEKL